MLATAEVCAHDHVLEIGCGWGSMAIRAVQTTGCRCVATCCALGSLWALLLLMLTPMKIGSVQAPFSICCSNRPLLCIPPDADPCIRPLLRCRTSICAPLRQAARPPVDAAVQHHRNESHNKPTCRCRFNLALARAYFYVTGRGQVDGGDGEQGAAGGGGGARQGRRPV